MTNKILHLRNLLTNRASNIKLNLTNAKMPERFKGTIVEKWVNYWKQLGIDYKEAGTSFYEEAKAKPVKTSIYTSIGMLIYFSSKKNPSETDFIENLRNYNNDLVLVHESCHKPESSNHVKFIQRCFNEGILRRLSLGFISFMWVADYDKGVSVYKAICPHLQPEYLTFHKRIIDVGFWGKWWNLQNKMVDYDVNV
ncbi:mitochondrial import inner membrane translocase subunit Tim29 [Condylostylus longicornis]|uniref:mitochondrial import inner membrane translocase subunit Tim29 n=1 Tax=Condylostylus longicornis TaxID=2530218 RepID=UPI00244E57A3|nr:mitochondrial import inner membrane translocase subunit Tim29 [Condylostylus longicornis]